MSVRYAYSRRPPSTISVYLADKALATLDCAGDGICSMSRDTSPAISMREVIFGGCTQSVIEHADHPVLLAH